MTLHFDGFDQFLNEPQFAAAMARAGYNTSGQMPVGVVGRNGTLGVACQNGAFSRVHPWLTNNLAVGCAMQFSDRGSIVWIDFGGDERIVLWTSPDDGLPRLNDDAGGALPVKDTWYYFEVQIDRTGNTASLFINNRADAVTTLTPAMAAATQVTVSFGMLAPSEYRPVTIADSSQKRYDDIYIRDGTRLGPVVITTRLPTGVQLSEWLVAGGSNAADVLGARPPDPMNAFTASDEVGKQDRFTSNQQLLSTNRIIATGLAVLTRKSPDMAANLRGFIGNNDAAAYRSQDIGVDGDWRLRYLVFDEVGSDTKSGIESAPFGVQIAAP